MVPPVKGQPLARALPLSGALLGWHGLYGLLKNDSLLEAKYQCPTALVTFLLILFLSGNFLLQGLSQVNLATDPEAYDTTAYLGEANFIKHNGGIANFFHLCVTGKYQQANQHPLYILALSTFASPDISFFIHAKILSLVFGWLLLFCLFVIGRKMYGDVCAAIAVFALSLNAVFLEWTSLVACESLLMLCALWSMYFIVQGFYDNRYWMIAGIFIGITYLTKGSALFLIPGFALSSFIVYRFAILRNMYFWSFFILFLLIASPLLIRNIRVYSNPFFNVGDYVISVGWEDLDESRYQIFDLKEGAGIWRFDANEGGSSQVSSSALSPSKVGSLFMKAMAGSVRESEVSSYDIWPGQNTFLSKLTRVLLLLSFVIGVAREKSLGARIYIVTTLFTFLVCLSFFRPLTRYFLPILPLLWIYIALGILTVLDLAAKLFFAKNFRSMVGQFSSYTLILTTVFVVTYTYATYPISDPTRSVDYSESRLDLLNWLRKNLGDDQRYTMGPNFNWQLERGIWVMPPKNAREDFAKFIQFVKNHNITYVILEWKSLLGGVDNKRKLVEDHFELNLSEGIVEKTKIDGWTLVYKDEKKPVEFLIYRVTR